ncbi:MAG TPA: hypothetical protein VEB18_01730 [Candidatus Paceibacterota bacterium]|nr:hypothetical protein [Candidatus Paceibacterota bacterium]
MFGIFKGLDTFQGEDEHKKRVARSTLGEADEILRRAIAAGDRGATLTQLERDILKHHHGDVFEEGGEGNKAA